MPGWLTNGWVVGIVSSLVAGGLISLISWFLLSKRRRQDLLQRVTLANREVMYAIRPGIAEGHIPAREVLDAMANATARKYNLERQDLLTPADLADELIKEVMDSSFLSSTQKGEYCANLAPLRQQPAATILPRESQASEDNLPAIISLIVGMMSALVSIGFQKTGLFKNLSWTLDRTQVEILVSIVVFTASVLILAFYYLLSSRARIKGATEVIIENTKKINEATKSVLNSLKR